MTRRLFSALVAALLICAISLAKPQQESNVWTIENDKIAFGVGYFDEKFGPLWIKDKNSGAFWQYSNRYSWSPIRFVSVVHAVSKSTDSKTKTHTFTLVPAGVRTEIVFLVQIYDGQPFLRTRFSYKNTDNRESTVGKIGLFEWHFDNVRGDYSVLRVNQWKHGRINFETLENNPDAGDLQILSGAAYEHCSWVAVKNKKTNNGLVGGWEFNGRAQGRVYHNESLGHLGISVEAEINYQLAPGESFESSASFLGLFSGDWDEAAYRTQRFVEQALAKPVPDPDKFPYLMFDTWGYGEDINEEKLFQAAKIAVELGVEVFTVDLGWAERIGDWFPDRKKFPRGLKPLSDYVHSLGMKFGLHWPLVQAHIESPVLKRNPDWTSSVDHNYFGANSLCLGHKPVKDWLIKEGIRIIQEYSVDWVLQDGENMVKVCDKTTHTHHPQGSNYANSERGLDEVMAEIQKATPDTVWENCEDGGNMMTYKMVGQYVTSILADDAQPVTTRQAVYGGTYPFPPRYSVRYVQDPRETALNSYYTRSYMFGGPLILMQRITNWTDAQKKLVKEELSIYKSTRTLIRDSKIIHLLERPDGKKNDAIQSYHEKSDHSIIFVYRTNGRKNRELIRPRGLKPDSFYKVRFQDYRLMIMASGRSLMGRGLDVPLPARNSAEIIYIEPLKQ